MNRKELLSIISDAKKHKKYLFLSGYNIAELPSEIGELKSFQELKESFRWIELEGKD